MITVRRAKERHLARDRGQEAWCTFDAGDRSDPLADGFGPLAILDEDRLPPGAAVARQPRDGSEILTYVREGVLAYEDSMGRGGVLHAGEFGRRTIASGTRHREANASRTDWAHLFQIWLRSSEPGPEPSHEQRRFSAAERRGGLLLVASPDSRGGSLRLHQDVQVYTAMLEPGKHVVHELSRGRSAWLHLVQGEVALGGLLLSTGDGAGVSVEAAVSVTAQEETELLLLDLRG